MIQNNFSSINTNIDGTPERIFEQAIAISQMNVREGPFLSKNDPVRFIQILLL